MGANPLTVVFAPVYPNPYQHLLAGALGEQGVRVIFSERDLPDAGWLRAHAGEVQVLHLHWLSGLYMQQFLTPLRVLRFAYRLRLARSLGYRIVWTAHNVLPHKRPFPALHSALRRFVIAQAGAMIVHCQAGRVELLQRFDMQTPVITIAHGRYPAAESSPESRAAARAALGIRPGQYVYLTAGNLSAYKGTQAIAEAFCQAAGPEDLMLIAGRNRDPDLVQRLQMLAMKDSRLRIWPDFVPDETLARFHLAADAAVFAFQEILTSGSVILALSYGLPVIVPHLGCLPELVTAEAGILYKPGTPGALAAAMRTIQERDQAQMRAAALATASALEWREIAAQTAAVYRGDDETFIGGWG